MSKSLAKSMSVRAKAYSFNLAKRTKTRYLCSIKTNAAQLDGITHKHLARSGHPETPGIAQNLISLEEIKRLLPLF